LAQDPPKAEPDVPVRRLLSYPTPMILMPFRPSCCSSVDRAQSNALGNQLFREKTAKIIS
jgi:hypothetical protein